MLRLCSLTLSLSPYLALLCLSCHAAYVCSVLLLVLFVISLRCLCCSPVRAHHRNFTCNSHCLNFATQNEEEEAEFNNNATNGQFGTEPQTEPQPQPLENRVASPLLCQKRRRELLFIALVMGCGKEECDKWTTECGNLKQFQAT